MAIARLPPLCPAAATIAHLEALGRALLDCDDVHIDVDAGIPAALVSWKRGAKARERLEIRDGGDEAEPQVGALSLARHRDAAFSSGDAERWRVFARAIERPLATALALESARQGRQEAERLLAAAGDGMLTLDSAGLIRTVNEAALAWLDGPGDPVLGEAFWQFLPKSCETELRQACEGVLQTGRGAIVVTGHPPRRTRLAVRIEPFTSGLAVFLRDVTAEHEIEEKLRQSQKLEVIGQLTGGIAHDVNNMLTVVVSNLEALAERAADRLETGRSRALARTDVAVDHSLASAALRAGESAAQLVGRLVAFARRQPLSPRVVDVAALLKGLGSLLRRSIAESVALRISAEPGLWQALVDPSELESAILNLALNSQDAMPKGGTLDIVAANVEVDRVYAAVAGLEQTGHFIAISVADQGVGMSVEMSRQAFDPFFTTKEAGHGTGLGLSMVYGFARQSGGLATIDSEPGIGTIVRIYLPRSHAPAAPTLALPTPGGVIGGSGHVLLVEDNDLVRARVEAMLRSLGYGVSAMPDGPRAVAALRAGLAPDLLLTDVVLPGGMTGRDVADASAGLVPGIRVLFTSGYAGDVLLRDGRLSPGVALLNKPFRRAELAACVRAQLNASPWRTASSTA